MKFTFRDILWVAIIALFFLALSKCHRNEMASSQNAINAISEQLQISDSMRYKNIVEYEKKVSKYQNDLNAAQYQLAKVETSLNDAHATNTRLSKAVIASKSFPVDTNFVTVSPDYVLFCDSLAINNESLSTSNENYRIASSLLRFKKDSVIDAQNKIIEAERTFNTECRRQFAALQNVNKQTAPKLKKQVYAGVEIIGNRLTVFQNVGAVLSLRTKTDKLWQLSGGLQSNGLYYGRINGNFLIKFHK